jgi:tetratricopeptide (TPR) repeat protein
VDSGNICGVGVSQADIELALGDYRLDEVIGQGGMGVVYRAEQLRLRRPVALKILAPELAGDASFRERFLRESQIAASLDHPHVVPVFDAGEADGLLYIAMRYVAGSDLRALLRREGALAPERASAMLDQIAGGLDAAHARGLVHLDVKPSNVLIATATAPDAELEAFLTDFGLSRAEADRVAGVAGGSAPYMSPEQVRGDQLDARSDVYSTACVLYECLTGSVPFVRDSPDAVRYAHLQAAPPALGATGQALPIALDGVVRAALAKAPAERPASVGELAEGVREALAGGDSSQRAAAAVRESEPARPDAKQATRRVADAPVVGRLDEQLNLRASLEDAIAGRGCAVLLVGEAGIGKTTLAQQLSVEAERQGVPVAWASGGVFGEAPPPYWHWVQIVRALAVREGAPELFAGLGAAAPWLGAIAPEITASLPAATGSSTRARDSEGRFQVYDALAQLVIAAARPSGLMIVLDDLHLADEATLLALSFTIALIRSSRVLVIAAYREDELTQARSDADDPSLAELARSGRRMALGGLRSEHVSRLISARTGGEVPPELVERVGAVTEGNPLFVSELLTLLEARGMLEDPGAASTTMPLPTRVRDAISERLKRLSEPARAALDVAAVIGTSFRVGTLAQSAETEAGELLDLLDEAERHGIVSASAGSPGTYAFTHGLIQATVYESLPRSRRCALHARVGEVLEYSYDVEAGEGLAEAAYHFLEAAPGGYGERALAYATRAAERALSTFAYDEAVTLYGRALEISDGGSRGRPGLLQALGEAQMRAGDTDAARSTLMRAAEAARAHGDPDGLARAALACNIWGLTSGVDEPLLRLAEEAVESLRRRGGSAGLLASTIGLLATLLYWTDQLERRNRLAAEALELARGENARARTHDSEAVLGYVIARRLLACWGPDSATLDFALSDELLELVRHTGEHELEILVRGWRIAVLLEMGDFSAVDREIAREEQMATELRQPRAMVFLPLHHATRAGTVGRFAEAEQLNQESMETGRRVRGTVGELAAGAQLVALRLQEGRLAELLDAITAITELHPGVVAFQVARALSLIQARRPQEASAELERLTSSGLAGIPRDNTHVLMLALLGEVAAELAADEQARQLFAWLEPYAGRWVVSPGAAALWPVDRSLGRLATVVGAHTAAEGHLRRAREQAARAGAIPSTALVALDEARLLLARGVAADRARAGELAREARELAQRIGMGSVVDAATLLEAELG